MMAQLRKWLILSHRYLGIAFGLLFVVWFASGIGMIYARGMPILTEELRLERVEPLDLESVRMMPGEAAQRAGLSDSVERVTLLMVLDRPAYRLDSRGGATVFADTGESMPVVGPDRAREVASRFMDVDSERVRYEELLTQSDQWTISLRRQLPFHKLSIDDDRGTQLYVSPESGAVTLLTTRGSRALAWVAAIPHWLYFTPLRVRQTLWTQTILWTAGIGCVLAILGITLGVLQARFSRPLRLTRIRSWIPYSGPPALNPTYPQVESRARHNLTWIERKLCLARFRGENVGPARSPSRVYKPFAAYQGDDPYIFVSYAHEDAERVYPELEWLRGQGFNVWYDEGISPGAVWREGLARAIKDSSLFLFYVTANSVTSPHCLRELNFGQEEERPFLAVHLEATRLPDALRLSISDRQAILAHELSRADFEEKLRQTLSSVVPVGSPPTASRATSWDPARVRRHSILGYALIALSILVVGVLFLAWPRTPPPLDPQVEGDTSVEASVVKSIAVLAFDNMSDDPQMNYLGDGIAEELMNALYQAGLRVASRTDAFSFKGANARTKEIGDELGVETVLEGSVRRSGDQLRITAQLINVADGFHLWSQVYERPVGDLFDVQDAIVREVSGELLGALGVTLAPSTADLAGTSNVQAYEVFMLGRYELRSDTPEGIARAIGRFEEAIRLDPDFHRPYGSLALAYSRRAIFTGERSEAQSKIAQIRREFEKREATWRDYPEWSRTLWEISYATHDPDGIERALASDIRATRTGPEVPDPLYMDPYVAYSILLSQSRLHEDAIKYAEARGGSWIAIAGSHLALGEPDRALDAIGRAFYSPIVGPFISGRVLAMVGRVEEARELLNDPSLRSPYRDYLRWEIAFREGDLERARAILEELEAADVSPTAVGVFRLEMGDVDAGFRHLERAVDQHDEILLYLGNTLEVALPENVLNDPRYVAVREATGFTAAWAKELCRRAAALTPVTGIEMSCLADL